MLPRLCFSSKFNAQSGIKVESSISSFWIRELLISQLFSCDAPRLSKTETEALFMMRERLSFMSSLEFILISLFIGAETS